MAIIQSDAILLRRIELRETSFLVDFYTRESGKIRGVIKGARSPEPQFGALYDVFTLDRIVFYEKKNKDVFIISQCELLEYFPVLRKSLEKISYACYLTELVDSTVGIGEKNEEIFELLLDSLNSLSGEGSAKRITRVFEIKLLKALGMTPELKKCTSCGNNVKAGSLRFSIKHGGVLCDNCLKSDPVARQIHCGTLNFIDRVMETPMEKVSRIKVSAIVGKELEATLRNFLNFHINKRFKTMDFIKEIGLT